MFIVFNKSKINSYLISLGTVIILFVMAVMLTKNEAIETAAAFAEGNISIKNTGTVFECPGVFRTESVYCPFLQFPGGWIRQCFCGKI